MCYLRGYYLVKVRYLHLFMLYFMLEQVVSLFSWHHQHVRPIPTCTDVPVAATVV